MKITQLINEETLKQAIEAVEENNGANDGKWSDWSSAMDIAQTYDIDLCEQGLFILERSIDSNGKTLAADMHKVGLAVDGQIFAGGFWDR